jgi:hypothetical protein
MRDLDVSDEDSEHRNEVFKKVEGRTYSGIAEAKNGKLFKWTVDCTNHHEVRSHFY